MTDLQTNIPSAADDTGIGQIAARLEFLRDTVGASREEMAAVCGVTPDEYRQYEAGGRDFSVSFLHKAAKRLGVDITDLMQGEGPHLSVFELTRRGEGLPIERRAGFAYRQLAYNFKGKLAQPFIVEAPYTPDEKKVAMSSHRGQEFDLVLGGALRMLVDGHEMRLGAGDSVYYDSSRPHGMTAAGPEKCVFLAVLVE
ncbi:MAG: XRE family transcriptional regulator [Oscillospiraceae bacterium]|nr:XRE family transcriptional regulator [Oscillospiraceae bacterium]